MNVRSYLLALVVVPVIGIVVVSAIGLLGAVQRLENAQYAQSVVDASVPLGDLVHELQTERGMASGYLASKGVDFAAELEAQRQIVDAALSTANAALAGKQDEYGEAINTLRGAVTRIAQMRTRVDSLAVSVSEMGTVYTDAIRAAMNLNGSLVAHFQSGDLAAMGSAWVTIGQAKEAAAQERAMGAIGFGSGAFDKEVLRRFAQNQAVQEATLDVFEKYIRTFSDKVNALDLPDNTALNGMRSFALNGNLVAIADIDSLDWFDQATVWINKLHAIELGVVDHIVEAAAEGINTGWRDLIIYVSSMAAALIASLIGNILVTRKFVGSFKQLVEATQSIARKDFAADISIASRVKEIDSLGASLVTMREDLAVSDQKLNEAYSKSFAFGDSDSAMMIVNPDLTIAAVNDSAMFLMLENADGFTEVLDNFDADDPTGQSIAGLMGSHEDMTALFSDPAQLPWRGDVAVGDLKLELNVSYVKSEIGDYAGNVVQARDVTQERLHSGMIAAMKRDHGVAEFKLDGSLVSANDNFAGMVGASIGEILGKHHVDLLSQSDQVRRDILAGWQELCNAKSFTMRLRMPDSDSGETWVNAGFSPVLDSSGSVFKVSLVAEDISESERTKARMERERSEAEAARDLVVTTLAEGLQSLSDGDLSYNIEFFFAEEYKTLRMDFNSAVTCVATAMGSVLESSNQLNVTAEELSAAATELARRTERQAASLTSTATALDEVTVTVQQTAQQALDADEAVKIAREDARANEVTVKEAMDVMDLIATSSNEISSITTLIDDISFQTNLLALNAGVEAARAGEAGRGFAVVASEVRALAQRAADAASEINGLISKSQDQVQSGVGLVASVGQSLAKISDQISVASESVQNIRLATHEQAETLNTVNASVGEIGEMTQQNAAMGEESSALSATLTSDANTLAETVSRFKIPAEHNSPSHEMVTRSMKTDAA